MKIREFFNRKRTEWATRKSAKPVHTALVNAINSQDLEQVKTVLLSVKDWQEQGLLDDLRTSAVRQAFLQGNPQIFGVVLGALGDPNVTLYRRVGDDQHEIRSLLFSAIENSQTDLALCLTRHPETDLTYSGTDRWRRPWPEPLEVSRRQGLTQVTIALAERLAEEHRRQAEALGREAAELKRQSPKGLPPPPELSRNL